MTPRRRRPSPHPAIAGREDELGDLAAAVRRLVDLTCRNTADAAETRAVATAAEALADRLARSTPADGTLRRLETFDTADPADLFQYDALVGAYNPMAPPVSCRWEDPVLHASAVFGDPWEGPPGVLHGGGVAAAFDAVLTVANIMTLGHPAPTARLTIDYRAPTPLHTPVRLEARVERRDGAKVTTVGTLSVDGPGGDVCARAEGLFIDRGAPPELLAQPS